MTKSHNEEEDKGHELINGFYYLRLNGESSDTLCNLYYNKGCGERGFGFNSDDGGGFLPINYLSEAVETEAVRVIWRKGYGYNIKEYTKLYRESLPNMRAALAMKYGQLGD